MAVRYGVVRRYGTVRRNFCLEVRYAFFVMVRVWYVGTLYEFVYLRFYMQRAAVNKDSCDRARRAHSLGHRWAQVR